MAQNLTEIGIAFRQMFTAWGVGEGYINEAMTALGMELPDLFRLVAVLVAMGMLYHFTDEKRTQVQGRELQITATYVYGIVAVALFWLAFVADSDVSGFMYFQF